MGEIADMIIDGLLDEETGEYIDGNAPGYPRTIRKHYSGPSRQYGVMNYTQRCFTKGAFCPPITPIIKEYALLMGWNYEKDGHRQICLKISNDFQPYKKWLQQFINK